MTVFSRRRSQEAEVIDNEEIHVLRSVSLLLDTARWLAKKWLRELGYVFDLSHHARIEHHTSNELSQLPAKG